MAQQCMGRKKKVYTFSCFWETNSWNEKIQLSLNLIDAWDVSVISDVLKASFDRSFDVNKEHQWMTKKWKNYNDLHELSINEYRV